MRRRVAMGVVVSAIGFACAAPAASGPQGENAAPGASVAIDWPLRINCGGEALESPAGGVYQADLPYDATRGFGHLGGEPFASYIYIGVGGSPAPALYLTERIGTFTYRFDVPDSVYVLTVRLAAMVYHDGGLGRFDIAHGGRLLADSLDLATRAPRAYAQDLRFVVASEDGPLWIRFRPTLGQAEVAGIELEPLPAQLPDPDPIEGLAAWDCPGGVFLHWDAPHPERVRAYRIRRAEGDAAPTAERMGRAAPPAVGPNEPGDLVELPRDGGLQERHWDGDAQAGTAYRYLVTWIDLLGRESAAVAVGPVTPRPIAGSRQPTFDLRVDPDSLRIILADPFREHWVRAGIVPPQGIEQAIRVRLRGDATRHSQKKSFKAKFLGDGTFAGRDVLNLVWKTEPTFLREALAAGVFRQGGVPAAEVAFLHLTINGRDQGLYNRIEQIDDEFLAARDLDPDGLLIEVEDGNLTVLPDAAAYARAYDRKTGDESDLTPFIDFIETVDLTDEGTFPAVAWDALDIESYLDWHALIVLTGNFDITRGNHYFHRPSTGGRWRILPWDNELGFRLLLAYDLPLDLGSEGSTWVPRSGPNRLITRVFGVEGFRRLHAMKLGLLLEEVFTEERLIGAIDSLFAAVREDALRDPRKSTWEDNQAFQDEVEDLRRYVFWRREHLRDLLGAEVPPPADVCFSEYSVEPDGLGFIELYNPTAEPRELAGLLLTDRPHAGGPTLWRPAGGVLAPGTCLVIGLGRATASERGAAFRPLVDGRGLALFRDGADGPELLDVVSWPACAAAGTLATYGGPGRIWALAARPTPGWNVGPDGGTGGPAAGRLAVRSLAGGAQLLLATLDEAGDHRIDLFDLEGRRVRRLLDGWLPAGTAGVIWDGRSGAGRPVAPGVYFARWSGSYSAQGRLVRVR